MYDGCEFEDPSQGDGPWPLIPIGPLGVASVKLIPDRHLWMAVDLYGVARFGEHFERHSRNEKEFYGYDGWELITAEMQRLDALWGRTA